MPRKTLVFAISFTAVLVAGVAFAQVGSWSPDRPAGEAMAPAYRLDERPEPKIAPTTTVAEEPEEAEEATPSRPERKPARPAEEPRPTRPPSIEILSPADGAVVHDKTIAFEGHVTRGARVFAGPYEADVNDHGVWRIVLVLEVGRNVATLRAIDRHENVAEATVTVVYQPPEQPKEEPREQPKEEPRERPREEPKEEPREQPQEEHEFSAHQKYGSCEENPPYDVFYGTGIPGHKVWVVSEYGSGTTAVGPGGGWDLKVSFPEAPYGVTFPVVIESGEHRVVFEFTRLGGGDEEAAGH